MPASQNARTHGFTAEHLAITPEERPDFEAFRDSLLAEFAPTGATEEFLFRRLLHAAWNIERIDRAEACLFANIAEDLLNENSCRILDRLTRYRTTHLRVFQYAKRTLEYEQTQRGLREVDDAAGTGEAFPVPPPRANFREVNNFTNQVVAYDKFGTLSPEMRDELNAMDIQARYNNMRMRYMNEFLDSHAARSAVHASGATAGAAARPAA